MNLKRIPLLFLMFGVVLKLGLILLWHLFHIPGILKLLIYYDPAGYHFANGMTRLLFFHRGFTFAPGAPWPFEVFLAIGFGLECLILGVLAQLLLRHFADPGSTQSVTTGS